MAPLQPATWDWWTWALYALAAYYLVNFFLHFFRFARLERRAHEGGPEEVERFNRALRGFPASGYAKMLGKRPLEADPGAAGGDQE
jgi:hypothetical protein